MKLVYGEKIRHFLAIAIFALLLVPAIAKAGDDSDSDRKFGPMQGTSASVSVGGGSMIPKGTFTTAYNVSYRDKYTKITGDDLKSNRNVNNTTVVHLFKFRYGLTDRIEVQSIIPYYTYDQKSAHNLDSWGDMTVAGVYGILQERLGDPVSVDMTLKAGLPTGATGPSALPGGNVWSGTMAFGLTKTWGLNQVALDTFGTIPFGEGNGKIRKGDSCGFNYKYAYALTKNFDIGIEGTIEHDARGKYDGQEIKNDATEWYTGPAVNYNIPGTKVDLAIGAYVPVYRSYGRNTSSDDVRLDGKLFIVW